MLERHPGHLEVGTWWQLPAVDGHWCLQNESLAHQTGGGQKPEEAKACEQCPPQPHTTLGVAGWHRWGPSTEGTRGPGAGQRHGPDGLQTVGWTHSSSRHTSG